jgi:hypothetical protein
MDASMDFSLRLKAALHNPQEKYASGTRVLKTTSRLKP